MCIRDSYHIDSSDRILEGNKIEHKPLNKDLEISAQWLPEGEIIVGVTSGASTPDRVVEEAIQKIFAHKALAVTV